MSYYTRFQIVRDEDQIASTEAILDVAGQYTRKQKWDDQVLSDLRDALETPECDGGTVNGLDCECIEQMMLHVSRAFPAVFFGVRGFGEECRDVWLREFRGGKVLFARGPFEGE